MFHVEHFEELVGAMSHKSMGTWWALVGDTGMIIRRLVGVDKYDNQSQITEVFHVEHLASGAIIA
jgi:hypothetical protein